MDNFKYLAICLLIGVVFTNSIKAQNAEIQGDHVIIHQANSVQDKNIIRFNYFRASVNGDASFGYERYIAPYISLEFGAGITYYSFMDFYSFKLAGLEYPFFREGKMKPSYSIHFGPKFYLKEEYMEGLYINPFLRHVNYKYTSDNWSAANTQYNLYLYDICATIGYNHFLGNVFLDYYGGLGYRNAVEVPESNNSAGSIKRNKNLPLIMLGVRIGFSF